MNKPRILESSFMFVFNKRQNSPIGYPAFVYTRVHMHIIYNWQRTLVLVNVALLTVVNHNRWSLYYLTLKHVHVI